MTGPATQERPVVGSEAEVGEDQRSAAPRSAVTGVVLCGGESSRMGRDKAELVLGGQRLVERSASSLAQVASRVVLACGEEPRYTDLGLESALDRESRGGPLFGLEAGLRLARTEWVAVVACDMPYASPALLERLLTHAVQNDLDICCPQGPHGLEPLCGVYRSACLPAVTAAIDAGLRRMIAFHDLEVPDGHGGMRKLVIERMLLEPEDRTVDELVNLNEPGDLERALERGKERS